MQREPAGTLPSLGLNALGLDLRPQACIGQQLDADAAAPLRRPSLYLYTGTVR